ncbi:MAG TPA: hypothetical protein VGB46_03530, partial [Flavisolibacter sp.]
MQSLYNLERSAAAVIGGTHLLHNPIKPTPIMGRMITPSLFSKTGRLLATVLLSLMLPLLSQTAQAQVWTIGTGTGSNGGSDYPAPFQNYYSGQRAQYLYTAAELTAAGMTPGLIHQLSFNVISLNSVPALMDFSISIGGTTATNVGTNLVTTGLTTVYTNPSYVVPGTGWVAIPFTTPFNWNGTDNIVVQACNWNGGAWLSNGNASVQYTSGLFTGASGTYRADSGGPFCTSVSTTNDFNVTTNRPNARFTRFSPCTGVPVAAITPAGPISSCSGAPVTLSTNLPPGSGYSFQWQDSTATTVWSNVGTNSSSYSFTVTGQRWYRLIVTCTNSNQTAISNVVQVNATSP